LAFNKDFEYVASVYRFEDGRENKLVVAKSLFMVFYSKLMIEGDVLLRGFYKNPCF
jgi:hypothetical protein